jgi:hypothetical protein
MGNEKKKKCNCHKEKKEKSKPPRPPKPNPPRSHENNCFPIPTTDIEIVCMNICGNIRLDQDAHGLEIWKKELNEKAIVTVSVFNSAWSSNSLQVLVVRMGEKPVVLNVPKGNSLSATVEDVNSIFVVREGEGKADGTFCLEICFPFRDKESFFK